MKIPLRHHLEGTEKLQELILHIARASEGDERFGLVKLNKLLFYSDFAYYLKRGRSITGVDYAKREHGPVPRIMPSVIRYLQTRNAAAVAERDYYGRVQKRLIALREPRLDLFTADEIAFVDTAVRMCFHMNASEISLLSHKAPAWELAEMNSAIPYEAALLRRPRTLTEDARRAIAEIDMDEARELLGIG